MAELEAADGREGGNQSERASERGSNAAMAGAIRCHYEVLEVEHTANDDEIKKAFRKLALKVRPQKQTR